MRKKAGFWALVAGLVVLSVLFAGCSTDTTPTTPVPTTTSVGPKFVAGDIIAKTASSSDSIWLIVRYDAKTDKYERAVTYKKSDGSWYRKDERTEPADRSQTEKLYPAKVTHVSSISAVPVVTATTIPLTTSTTVAATTAPLGAPTVTGIVPNSGVAGTTVNITGIAGTNFRTGATVRLVNGATSLTISGTSVTARSASNITCLFPIPSTAIAGRWNVTVTNPDGQVGRLANGFTITNTTTTSTTTTTTTTAPPAPTVSGITPNSGIAGMQVNITNLAGSNLLNLTTVKLTRSGSMDISATNVTVISSNQIACTFALPSAASGTWNVLVTNSGSQSGIGTGLFTVNPFADFKNSTTPISGIAPLTVSFDDMSTGSPTAWTWNFGDYNSTAIQSPSHTYAFAGTFTVSLTVTNAGGSDTRTKTGYITVLP